jgi:hypothetical protein
MLLRRITLPSAAIAGAAYLFYRLSVNGSLTLDTGLGRSICPLGPLVVEIHAPREIVFSIISSPYLARTPRAMQAKLRIIERGADLVLAEHRTTVGRQTGVTLETVRFEPPERISFRTVRGPVPEVTEQFVLAKTSDGTELRYDGTLSADLWGFGRWWGQAVARRWVEAVEATLASVKTEAERRAAGKRWGSD